ncbi:hypothetical protein SAMN05216389_112103 [Oceanobacillus limi]|uniref:Uncharacterized protein n=1 Tax=Oceanobacillus limi TaxID=930131 RepID=A0A1I0EUA5_9BACI|nr:hypothetical protein SAMN05216389_112103 [Oceanobacillus limi]
MNEQFAKKYELQINEEESANIEDQNKTMNFDPIEKYQAAEYLYIYGDPITKIASLLNIDRKKLISFSLSFCS